jgi:hypothetical protein
VAVSTPADGSPAGTRDLVLDDPGLPGTRVGRATPVPDAVLGAASVLAHQLGHLGHVVVRLAAPGARLVLDPPFVPFRRRPARVVDALADRGRRERLSTGRRLEDLVAVVVPALVDRLAQLVPLTDLVRQSIDLDAVVADVDLDTAAGRIDLDSLAARIDIDAIVRRLDIEAIVRQVDLTRVVMEQVDLDAVVAGVDLDAIIDRIDLEGLANEVIDAIDLPEIIRESSGTLASETVRNVRMQSIDADRAVERIVDRLRLHRNVRPDGHLPGGTAT